MSSDLHPMWAERYRPKSLNDCVLEILTDSQQAYLINLSLSRRELPNILFYGPPGTGKTTIARILADEGSYCASFYNGSLIGKEGTARLEQAVYSIPLWGKQRVNVIDEADGLTKPAQLALRAIIELPISNTAWIMICNDKKSLHEPILSRMMQINFSIPPRDKRERHMLGLVNRCQSILTAEKIHGVDEKLIRTIVERYYPDVRQIITALQLETEIISA